MSPPNPLTDSVARVIETARTWRDHDPDPATRAELAGLIEAAESGDAAAGADLDSRFRGPLTFGTAGLRGEVGAGETRMNVAVVTRATYGLGRHLIETVGPDARAVIGCDARYGSDAFLDAAAEVLAAQGVTVMTLPRRLPTPVTAYATRALDCDAGVMITASHNPPADNGYKVYLGGRATDSAGRGVQIVPPADEQIAAFIDSAPPADEITRDAASVVALDGTTLEAYIARAAALRPGTGPSPVRVVLTPMHGVGGSTALAVLSAAGVTDVHVVGDQFSPDPDFPTVPFPNPEEPGALDRALDLARHVDAHVVIALDPDADRCSVATPTDRGWRQLTGDEIGWLLGEQAARDAGRNGNTLACSIVSSRLLGKIAGHHGLRFAATLTGFKWIARTPDLRFGYEEAIGYCTDPEAVRDKDGISAMVRVIGLVEELAADGRTLVDLLDDLARRHGLHATAPLTIRVDDVAEIGQMMDRLRTTTIDALAGSQVVEVLDLATGSGDLPPTDALVLRTATDDRVIVRPSGTEPKLKCYLEVVLDCADTEVPHVRAAERLQELSADIAAVLRG
ncbi:phospho-sugar mutase [Gordonia alkanivorans]|uniref:phospho-sugar mutase n=1 Tax=Gordonia alkanivorans TaxID=84096 RepID=UPI0005A6BF30|nr:phospho-sugar mutase [Gordonia alkanivorans]MDH3006719.1 phospho-sugar mutase [Gordonia alkanivorans]MDH3010034.1 phospho-sugar mutase [Gordonia alkanivorans]MDH3014478.1 phospho-sugar mutase [Gordonia alkanivorans]MDH3023579.1 phospho-sugar mutase [Gordonia alkanivorans]MDH3041734.1 phospho-sugar mutase [Gordonia alkanivorans]